MKLQEIIRMIVVNLIQNKYKVILTSLGIIIGTMTIILVIAIGRGGEKQIADQFKNMSAETIYVNYQPTTGEKNKEKIERLGIAEIDLIRKENPYIKGIYLRDVFAGQIQVNQKKQTPIMTAVSQGYAEISHYIIENGNDFSELDYEESQKVLVLGYTLAEKYFGNSEQALGQSVQIKGIQYEVIGVLKKTSEGFQGVSPDDTVFIPYATVLENQLNDGDSVPQAVALATNKEVVKKAIKRIQSSLDYVFDDSSVYQIEDAGNRIKAAMESATTMKLLLVSVAAIVFVVGGIGIMNVLFVSVKERTREIGILKAIGTTKKDILLLFLLESIGIGVLGGVTGVGLSYFVIPLLERGSIPMYATLDGKMIAFVFAVLTSAIFGFYPAYKAAKLTPIDALNHD